MTPAAALLKLLTEIDRTCIAAVSDDDKILVALDRSQLDRYWNIAHSARMKEIEDDHNKSHAP